MMLPDPGFGPWQPPTWKLPAAADIAAVLPRERENQVLRRDAAALYFRSCPRSRSRDDDHNPVTEVRHGPLVQVCSWCGAWRGTGEYLGRGVVRFGSAATARRFVEIASWEMALRPMARLELSLQPSGAYAVLEALGSDEQLGMRLHIAAVTWLQAEGEPVAVDRLYVAPPGEVRVKVTVKETGR